MIMKEGQTSTLVLGEGITEFYYFNSIHTVYPNIIIQPRYPKHTSLSDLQEKIEEGIKQGFRYIFCVIDMDTKENGAERTKYMAFKNKYAGEINKPKKGILCKIEFFETHRCTELFFLYYFQYTSRVHVTQDELLEDLRKKVAYEKTNEFFRKSKGLHSFLEENGGKLSEAIANANKSMTEKEQDGRNYTYSELGKLMQKLDVLCRDMQED